jgi:hypothetical protein
MGEKLNHLIQRPEISYERRRLRQTLKEHSYGDIL